MRSFTLFFSLVLITPVSFAVDVSGNYAVWGLGSKSCFAYNEAVAAEKTDNYKHYMKGFLTAYNIFTEKTYSITGKMKENQIVEWINNYCEENPMSAIENALVSFTFEHYDKRMKSANSTGKGYGR